jgi:putative endonuclease
VSKKDPSAFGRAVEDHVLRLLKGKHYKLVERNFRCRGGEIDLVMTIGGPGGAAELVFVEVRYRKRDEFGDGGESVDRHKQRRLRIAAETWLQHHPDFPFHYCRFDVVSVTGNPPDFEIEWIEDAF